MGFQQGLSGLNASAKNLEVIGNNVANSQTVGFKGSRAEFGDVFANALNGSGASQIGIGVKINDVAQQFTQGNISITNNTLDLAINGAGFFRMNNDGEITYARNGQFQLNKDGFIVNSSGKTLTGYMPDVNGNINQGAMVDIRINPADLNPRATTDVETLVNLDSREPVLSLAAFDPSDPDTYNSSTAVAVYDSLGNAHTVQQFFVKTGPGVWDVVTTANGAPTAYTPPAAPVATAQLTFGPTGTQPVIAPANPVVTFPVVTGAGVVSHGLDFGGSTQFGSNFSVNNMTQDGYASGKLAGFDLSEDGNIVGRYTNGQTSVLGRVLLANFRNPNGLKQLGDNSWLETNDSGVPIVGQATTGGLGTLQSSAVEDSNVDLTAELVNMITAQRAYQANAQTVKTQDQVLQTIVNLR